MKLKHKIFILCFSFFVETKAQNLVPNSSFEDTLHCPTSTGQISPAIPWYSASNGTPDYYNKYCGDLLGVPSNEEGYQFPRTGNAYAGIGIILAPTYPNFREYIEVQLDSTLKAGKKYCVWFYVSLANFSKYAVDTLGVYLSDTSIFVNTTGPLPFTPQIKNKNGIISDTLNWVEISGEYIASGGEQYITIGVFNNDSTVKIVPAGSMKYDQAYYYIDDVTVIACNGLGVDELNDAYKIKVYPNPAINNVTFTAYLPEKRNGSIEIYNMMGSKIVGYVLKQGDNKVDMPTANFSEGIYLYKVIVDGELKQSDKLVIIK